MISVDITGKHPKSLRSNEYIVTVVDIFSKWAEAYPVANRHPLPDFVAWAHAHWRAIFRQPVIYSVPRTMATTNVYTSGLVTES